MDNKLFFDEHKEYELADLSVMKNASNQLAEKDKQVNEYGTALINSTVFYLGGLMTPDEVQNQTVLGCSPYDLDIEKVESKLDKVITPPKKTWRTRLISFFFPNAFANEALKIDMKLLDVGSFKNLRGDMNAISSDVKIHGNLTLAELAKSPSMKFILAKIVESVAQDCQSYSFGPFKIASPFKHQMNQLLSSDDWLTKP